MSVSAQFQAAYNPTYASDTAYTVQRDAIKRGICPLHLDEKISNVNGAYFYGKKNRKCPKCEILFQIDLAKKHNDPALVERLIPDAIASINNTESIQQTPTDVPPIPLESAGNNIDSSSNEKALRKGYCYFHPHVKVKNVYSSLGILRSSVNLPCSECLRAQLYLKEHERQISSASSTTPSTDGLVTVANPSHNQSSSGQSTPTNNVNHNLVPNPEPPIQEEIPKSTIERNPAPTDSSLSSLDDSKSLTEKLVPNSNTPDRLSNGNSFSNSLPKSEQAKPNRPIKSLNIEEVMRVISNNEILRKYKYRIQRYSVNGEHIHYRTFSEKDYIYYLRMTKQDAALFKRKSEDWILYGVTEEEFTRSLPDPTCSSCFYRW